MKDHDGAIDKVSNGTRRAALRDTGSSVDDDSGYVAFSIARWHTL